MRDPEVETLTSWFLQTHEIQHDPMTGQSQWRRFALPMGGGAGDQDARLMAGLDLMRSLYNEVIADEVRLSERELTQKPRRMKDE